MINVAGSADNSPASSGERRAAARYCAWVRIVAWAVGRQGAALCALAVLLGLLAMHGLPFGADGCKDGAMTATAPSLAGGADMAGMGGGSAATSARLAAWSAPAVSAGDSGSARAAAVVATGMASGSDGAPSGSAGAGTTPSAGATDGPMSGCVSLVPFRPSAPVLALVFALSLLGAVAAGVPARRVGRPERPPSPTGVSLLRWVCVSRT
jgi:hypothetical protein